jgi:hypothetical protein
MKYPRRVVQQRVDPEDTYFRWLQSDDDDLRAVFDAADGVLMASSP